MTRSDLLSLLDSGLNGVFSFCESGGSDKSVLGGGDKLEVGSLWSDAFDPEDDV